MLVGAQLQTLTAQASWDVSPHLDWLVLVTQMAFTLSRLRETFPDRPYLTTLFL